MSAGPQSPTQQPLSYMEAMLLLTKGEEFIKYRAKPSLLSVFGRSGAEKRYVFYEKEKGNLGKLWWCKPGMRTKDDERCIPLSQVTGLYEQAETEAFSKKLTAAERACCFSIVCGPKKNEKGEMVKGRTLDLQAKTVAMRDTWMHCIHQLLVHSGFNVHEQDSAGHTTAGVKSPTSASREAINAAARLNKINAQNAQTAASPMNVSVSGFSSPIPINSPGPLQSPQAFPPQTSPSDHHHASGLASVVSSPVAGGVPRDGVTDALPSSEPDALVIVDDPLVHAKLIQSLSPTSNAELPLPHDQLREIPATLTVPAAAESAHQLLSPSEHPTQTPMCSPIAVV
jgi:hypothetical protein